MLSGVYPTQKKDGTPYYRAGIHYKNKHISLGSYSTETDANTAYLEAGRLLKDSSLSLEKLLYTPMILSFEKLIVLLNFRDNGMYIKTPIYLRQNYFSYYLSRKEELKFDIDDLFFYSQHKIMKRGGHLFVSEYGMQTSLLSRYGIKSHGVPGRDYTFANGDSTDLRYSNIIVINPYYGVVRDASDGKVRYKTYLHINGNFLIGTYSSGEKAAVAYNKAVDLAKAAGIQKNYPENYIEDLSAKDYAELYTRIKISSRYLSYLASLPASSEKKQDT